MRMKWKYPAYFGGLVLVLAATAVACSENSTSPRFAAQVGDAPQSRLTMQELQDRYGWMGRYHTQALTYIYSKLSEGKLRLSKSDKCRIATNALKEFDRTFSKDAVSKGLRDDFLPADLCADAGQVSASMQSDAFPTGISPRAAMSTLATSLLQQIENLFDTDASLSSIKSSIYSIESTAAAKLVASEAGAVVGAGSIAISSADYWNANLSLWQSSGITIPAQYNRLDTAPGIAAIVLAAPANAPRYGLSALGKRIMKADVYAAVGSLVTSWWMGALDVEVSAVRGAAASALAAIT